MNDRCEGIRERIEYSVGRALGADEQDALDLHCAECESCREYREKLLDDHSLMDRFAARHSSSELRAEERVIAALPAKAAVPARRRGIQRAFPKVPGVARIALAAAIVIAVIVGIDFLLGVRNGPVPAFASVVEKMEKAENVVYRERVWILGEWRTIERARNQAGFSRYDWEDSTHVFYRGGQGGTLSIYPAEKRAVLEKRTYEPLRPSESDEGDSLRNVMVRHQMEREKDPVGDLSRLYKKKGHIFVRRERRERKNLAVYEFRIGDNYKWTTWVDVDTELPFRIEIVRRDPAKRGASYMYGLDVSDFQPQGALRSSADGWTDHVPGEPTHIWDNFRWNTQLDTAYFSMTPPDGYAATIIDGDKEMELLAKRWREGVSYEASEIAKTLSIWISLSGGAFPDDLEDLGNSAKVRTFLIAKYDKDGRPGDEFRAAMHDSWQIDQGYQLTGFCSKKGALHYLGRGSVFGDSTRIVCWGKETGMMVPRHDNPYWIIYADLRCVQSKTPPKISKK